MITLNILNMKNFLQTVNECDGSVDLLVPDGAKADMRIPGIQEELLQQHRENKNYLQLSLSVTNPKDYMRIVSYYAGDC